MQYVIECRPSYSLLEVRLEPGEQIVTESGAMSWMTDNLKVQTSTRGGLWKGLKRKLLSGESFFQNTYEAEGGPGILGLAPGQAGDILVYELDGELFLEKNAYLASTPDIHCDAKFDGLRGLFSEGFFVLRVTGAGTLFFNAYGDVEEIEVDGSYIVDNGHAVAWEPTLEYRITRARKIRSFLFADQLLMNFSGRGKLWVQSRSPRTLANWVHPFRPQGSK
ncbi:MAG: TIGR00266 family protein [Planctomycetes bacterium]|nr:TIGR00266 family protein [Planctomycetota bacterium]